MNKEQILDYIIINIFEHLLFYYRCLFGFKIQIMSLSDSLKQINIICQSRWNTITTFELKFAEPLNIDRNSEKKTNKQTGKV